MEEKIINSTYYNIFIGNNWKNEFLKFLEMRYLKSKIFILVDENTNKYCLPKLEIATKEEVVIIEIKSGEKFKNIETVKEIWKILLENNAERNSLMINLGGGVIGDMGGFAASTFKRGMDFINIPTTLLAQVDASIGGKTGIDFENIKNIVGTFNEPAAIFINPDFLITLPQREFLSGFAEIIKHTLIMDKALWKKLKTLKEDLEYNSSVNWEDFIFKSVLIKKQIVESDPTEKGLRKKLNFGHTIGHSIETYSMSNDNNQLLHGEAIAIGMICEAFISYKLNGLMLKELNELCNYIISLYPKYDFPKSSFKKLIKLMQQDKKNVNGEINFTLLNKIGKSSVNMVCPDNIIFESLEFYQALD